MKLLIFHLIISCLSATKGLETEVIFDLQCDELISSCFSLKTKQDFIRSFLEEYSREAMINRRLNTPNIFSKIARIMDSCKFADESIRPYISSVINLYRMIITFNFNNFGTNIFNDAYNHTLEIIENIKNKISIKTSSKTYEFSNIEHELEAALANIDLDKFKNSCSEDDFTNFETIKNKCKRSIENLESFISEIFVQNSSAIEALYGEDGILFIKSYLKNSCEIFINALDVITNFAKIIKADYRNELKDELLDFSDSNYSDDLNIELLDDFRISYSKLTLNLLRFLVFENRQFYEKFNRYFIDKLDLILDGRDDLHEYSMEKYYEAVDFLYNNEPGSNNDSEACFCQWDHNNMDTNPRVYFDYGKAKIHIRLPSNIRANPISSPINFDFEESQDSLSNQSQSFRVDSSTLKNLNRSFKNTHLRNGNADINDNNSMVNSLSNAISFRRRSSNAQGIGAASEEEIEKMIPSKRSRRNSSTKTKGNEINKRRK